MTRLRISSGSSFEEKIGYSRAIVHDNWVFVSGTTGFDYSSMIIADDIVVQTEQCLQNIIAALTQAGASLADVVRVNYVVPDATQFELCWPVLRQYFGDIRPAAMMISAGLADPRMKIEIEVTAIKQAK
jgi:enamine deaminase RidA (YjgF/YER057c/UK114 family)